jgi:hypothetical protein
MANSQLNIDVKIKGPLFDKRIDDTVKAAMLDEVFEKVDARVARIPRSAKLGRKNNTISSYRKDAGLEQTDTIESTLNWPRTTGRSWLGHNMAAIRKMAPNVIRAAGRRIAKDLGGN